MPIRLPLLFQEPIQKSGIDFCRLKVWVPQNAPEEGYIRLDPANKILIERPLQTPYGLSPIRAVADQLGQQRIVIHGHRPALIHPAIAPDARPRRRQQQCDLAGAREVIVIGIFGINAALDGMAANVYVILLERQRLSIGDMNLQMY